MGESGRTLTSQGKFCMQIFRGGKAQLEAQSTTFATSAIVEVVLCFNFLF